MSETTSVIRGSGGSKRGLLLLAVVALVTISAGCLGMLSDDGDRSDQVDVVPADANVLVHVDTAILGDAETQELFASSAENDPSTDVEDMEDAITEFEDETGLDVEDANQLLVFASVNSASVDDEDSVGIVVDADWDVDDVVSALEAEDGVDYEQTSHAGENVLYKPTDPGAVDDPMFVGELDDGQLVVGDRSAVEGSIEVSYTGADPVSGPVRDAFEENPDALVTFAVEPPTDALPQDDPAAPQGMDLGAFQDVEAVAGYYSTGGGDVTLEARLLTGDDTAAEDIKNVFEAGVSMYAGMLDDPELEDQLRSIQAETDGSTVVLTFEGAVDDLVALTENV